MAAWPPRTVNPGSRAPVILAVAGVAVAVFIGLNLLMGDRQTGSSGFAVVSPSAVIATVRPTLQGWVPADFPDWDYAIERHDDTVDGIKFSVDTHGWAPFGLRVDPTPLPDGVAWISLNESYHPPQGAEAMIYWTSPFGAMYTDPCEKILTTSSGQSVADLAAIVAGARGTDLISGPMDVVIGGRPAKFLVVSAREDIGCDPGYFFSWDDFPAGPMYERTEIGDTIRVWIVNVDGRSLFIVAETHPDAPSRADEDVHEIVESIEFE